MTALEIGAAAAVDLGYFEAAVTLFSAAAVLRERHGVGPVAVMLLGDARERAEQSLEARAARDATVRGSKMSAQEEAAYALGGDDRASAWGVPSVPESLDT